MTIFRHSNYAVPASRTDSFSPIVTSALAPALGQKGTQNVRHPIAQLKTLFNFRFKLMKHPMPQNIISRRFFAGTLAAIFGVVSFSVPSPAFAIAPNQNPVKIFSDDFESGNFSKWVSCLDKITTTQVHSGARSLHYDGWPGCAGFLSKETREAYFKVWWFMPTVFPTVFAGGRHYWRLTNGNSANYQIQQIDTGGQGNIGGLSNWFEDVFFFGVHGPAFRNSATLPVGRWFKFEYYVRFNDPGVANGERVIWVDGVKTSDIKNVNLNVDKPLNMLLLTTNYDNCSGCGWYMDDVEVWDGCPAGAPCGAGASPTPSPTLSPPRNLTVSP